MDWNAYFARIGIAPPERADLDALKLWHRVKTGTLNEVRARADAVIAAEWKEV